ncbi:transmembrane 4 L6 family member 5-like [Pelobates fuscus]|uniref:transmembrane 4 L6 family member 5-like n=1 Tax=Pelobates fuscus TaxID=191477 RepID=UPI002FE4444D
MCTGKCSTFIGVSLFPVSLVCVAANLMMFFPDGSREYLENAEEQITQEVRNLGGVIGGGLLVLFPAIHIIATGRMSCCSNRCGMLMSILLALVGIGGALFGFLMSIIGLLRGPVCQFDSSYFTDDLSKPSLVWGRPFSEELKTISNESYLLHRDIWNICVAPPNVVLFNVILFSIIMVATGAEIILCAIQTVNGLFGCICGTCQNEKSENRDKEKMIELP